MNERLNEDSDRYCMFWLGIVMLTAYLFEFVFYQAIGIATRPASSLLVLMGGPVLLTPLLFGYFLPERGKRKNLFLSLSTFVGLMYVILTLIAFDWNTADTIWYASWGIGAAIFTSGGAAMLKMTTREEAYTPGILDVSKLHYGPPAEEPMVEVEATTIDEPPVSASSEE